MDSVHDTPKGWVAPFGHPRIKACSRLPMAFRSVPRPSSPPGAKASTECPSLARNTLPGQPPGASTMHRNHPQITRRRPCMTIRSPPTAAGLASVPPHGRPLAQHTSDPPDTAAPQPATRPTGQTPKDRHRPRRKRIRQIVPTPLNTRHADTRGPCTQHAHNTPGQTRTHAAGQTRAKRRSLTATAPGTSPSRAPRDAPEPDSP
jgi:hypothetical protein